jgi:hypothetical protein
VAAPKPSVTRPNAPAAAPPRRDPPRRHIDGTAPWARLKSLRTQRAIAGGIDSDGNHYVLVYENSPDSQADYSYKGYQTCFWGQCDIVPLGGKSGKPGEPITVRGHLLMMCPAETYQSIVQEGQDLADQKHNQIFRRKRPAEYQPMTGHQGRTYADFRNDSSSGVIREDNGSDFDQAFESSQEIA